MIKIIKDTRLEKANTGYTIYGDHQDVPIRKGESTTNPKEAEKVAVNVKMKGKVTKGNFNVPEVWFTNCLNQEKYFDHFALQTWREDLPTDPSTDWVDDLGIRHVLIAFALKFTCEDFDGVADGAAWLYYRENDRAWYSDHTPITPSTQMNGNGLHGSFTFIVDENQQTSDNPLVFDTGIRLQDGKLPLYIHVDNLKIVNGNSEMALINRNTDWKTELHVVSFELVGGES